MADTALPSLVDSCYEERVQDLIAKAATLLEALPYIQKFSGPAWIE